MKNKFWRGAFLASALWVLVFSGIFLALFWRAAYVLGESLLHPKSKLDPPQKGLIETRIGLKGPTVWKIPARSDAVLIYLHGAGENISTSSYPFTLRKKLGVKLILINYLEGRPFEEEGLARITRQLADYIASLKAKKVILYGHSLGAYVAAEVSTKTEVDFLILDGGFTSADEILIYKFSGFPWLAPPLRRKFSTVDSLKGVSVPFGVIYSENDQIIPPEMGKELCQQGATLCLNRGGKHHPSTMSEPQQAILFGEVQKALKAEGVL